jgi:tRNA pseudouridine55 synthase
MLDSNKSYDFTIQFGIETDTLDGEGQVVSTSDVRASLDEMEAVLERFTGPIEQVPPVYSALKIDGKAAYARARAGEAVEMKTRLVTIHMLSVRVGVNGTSDPRKLEEITLTARVSKGTYIRSLARDIARALGTVGHVVMLRRTRAGPFTLAQAISLDKLAELGQARELEQALLPLTAGLDDIPALSVTPDQARLLRQGRKLVGIAAQPGLYLATDQSVPVALVELEGPELRVVRGFNLQS